MADDFFSQLQGISRLPLALPVHGSANQNAGGEMMDCIERILFPAWEFGLMGFGVNEYGGGGGGGLVFR